MASRPDVTTSTTSCWQWRTRSASDAPTVLWSSAIKTRMGGTWQNFACQPSEFPVLLLPACFLAMVAGMKPRYDVVILGAGHNGMVAAAYLTGAGLSVLLLEKND